MCISEIISIQEELSLLEDSNINCNMYSTSTNTVYFGTPIPINANEGIDMLRKEFTKLRDTLAKAALQQ